MLPWSSRLVRIESSLRQPNSDGSSDVPKLASVLLADALACLISGTVLAVGSDTVAPVLLVNPDPWGLPAIDVVSWLGWFVLAVGFWCAALGTKNQLRLWWILPVLVIEIVWSIASLVLLLTERHELTPAGIVVVLAGAAGVALFFVLEAIGLLREHREHPRIGQRAALPQRALIRASRPYDRR